MASKKSIKRLIEQNYIDTALHEAKGLLKQIYDPEKVHENTLISIRKSWNDFKTRDDLKPEQKEVLSNQISNRLLLWLENLPEPSFPIKKIGSGLNIMLKSTIRYIGHTL